MVKLLCYRVMHVAAKLLAGAWQLGTSVYITVACRV